MTSARAARSLASVAARAGLGSGSVPPPRNQVDGSVAQFKAFDAGDVVTLSLDGNLRFEHGPFTTVPPNRQLIDRAIRP